MPRTHTHTGCVTHTLGGRTWSPPPSEPTPLNAKMANLNHCQWPLTGGWCSTTTPVTTETTAMQTQQQTAALAFILDGCGQKRTWRI